MRDTNTLRAPRRARIAGLEEAVADLVRGGDTAVPASVAHPIACTGTAAT